MSLSSRVMVAVQKAILEAMTPIADKIILDPDQERIVAVSGIFGFFQLGKVQNFTASFSSSELSAHQMAPSGVIAHKRVRPALQPT